MELFDIPNLGGGHNDLKDDVDNKEFHINESNETLKSLVGTEVASTGTFLRVPRECFFDALHLMLTHPQRADDEAAWPCPECGEEVPGNFDVCWNCGAARHDGDADEAC